MSLYNEVEEKRARLGNGALYTSHFNEDGKFSMLIPTGEIPFIQSETSEVEVKVTSSTTITKIAGVETLNTAETPIYMHRDCIRLLEKVNGKTIELLSVTADFTAYKYSATISYTPSNATMDDAWQGTLKLTPVTKPEYIDNCYQMLKATVFFTNNIDSVVELGKTTEARILEIETKYDDATVEATCEDTTVATATISSGKLTITGKKEGSISDRISVW